jgi:hypothetical protein
MLLKIKDDDDRAMDAVEEKVHKEYQKKLQKKGGKGNLLTSLEGSDGSPEIMVKRSTSPADDDGGDDGGILFNVQNQEKDEKEMSKRRTREQIKVYAITYIAYALIHF